MNEREQWLASLKPGDKVSVYDRPRDPRHIYDTEVIRRTPSGRIVCRTNRETVFKSNGYLHVIKQSVYASRFLQPLKQEEASERTQAV